MLAYTALARLYEQSGFTLVRKKKHPIWRCPCGHAQITESSSRHGGSGDINARTRIARTLRVCSQQMKECA